MCGCCGAEIKNSKEELFTVLHNNTNVLLNKTEAKRVNEEMYDSITKNKRLVLLLDLDQTVIHTSVSAVFGAYYTQLKRKKERRKKEKNASLLEEEKENSILSVREIRIEGYSYYVKERDRLSWFLKEVSKYYEIHIYTMGNKAYASAILDILDKDREIFGNRVVTRDDNFGCFDKDIKRLFPTNSKHVVILDDRPDVWGFVDNLYPIRPYYFFQTEDINNPDVLRETGGSIIQEEEKTEEVEKTEKPEEIIKRLDTQCIASYFDNELERVLSGLIDVHRRFFEKDLSTAEILREKKRIFTGCVARIVTPIPEYTSHITRLFHHYGGRTTGGYNATHVIAGGARRVKYTPTPGVSYVSVEWINESVFALKKQNEKRFILESVEEECTDKEQDEFSEDETLCLNDIDTEDDESENTLYSSDDSLYRQILDD